MKISNLGALRYQVLGSILFSSDVYKIPKLDHLQTPTKDRLRELGFDLIGETNSDTCLEYSYHLVKLPTGWYEAGQSCDHFFDTSNRCRITVSGDDGAAVFTA